MGLVRLAAIDVPLWPALALFGAAWLIAQLLGHAAYPLLRLGYAADGGELGRAGLAAAAAAVTVLVASAGFAYSHRPPVVRLAAQRTMLNVPDDPDDEFVFGLAD